MVFTVQVLALILFIGIAKINASETVRTRTAEEHLHNAYKLISSGQYQNAINYIDKAIIIDPENSWYLKQRAICHANLNHYKQFDEDVIEILKINEDDPDIKAIKMLQNMAMPHSDNWRSEEEFNQKLNDPLTSHEELTKLGHELFHLRKYDQALKFHDAALRKEATIAAYFKNRALCYAMLRGHLNKVRSDLLIANTLDPNDEQLETLWRLAVLNDAGQTESPLIHLWQWSDQPTGIIEDLFQ